MPAEPSEHQAGRGRAEVWVSEDFCGFFLFFVLMGFRVSGCGFRVVGLGLWV